MAKVFKPAELQDLHKLASMQCSDAELAAFFNRPETDLEQAKAKAVIQEARGQGRSFLRRRQWEVAMSGSVPMLIFLGKNLLSQCDNPHFLEEAAAHAPSKIRIVVEDARVKDKSEQSPGPLFERPAEV